MSLSVEIRLVDAGSAGLLDRVADDVFDHAVQPALLAAFLDNPANQLLVAVADGVVVGMASGIAHLHPDKPLALFINEVGVAPTFRRQGLGRRLVQAMLERGRALGCDEAWVATEAGNAAARALYRATGGRPDDDGAIVYVYALNAA